MAARFHTGVRGNTACSPPALRSRSPPLVAATVQIKLKGHFPIADLVLPIKVLVRGRGRGGAEDSQAGGREGAISAPAAP